MPQPYVLVSKERKPEPTIIPLGRWSIGGKSLVIIAGPCAVENEDQIVSTARCVKEAGAHMLRGGAFKVRTSPYSFQGLGEQALELLKKAKEITGLPLVVEVMDSIHIPLLESVVDMLQIGTRNMQNVSLLKAVGKSTKPVLLKRGTSATLAEFLMAAEYIMEAGNPHVVLCERGIRTFSDFSRYTLDLNIIPALKRATHLPVIVDPSHATGNREYVIPLARAAIAAGADGIMVEVHPKPEEAASDGAQSLSFQQFEELMQQLKVVARAVGRDL